MRLWEWVKNFLGGSELKDCSHYDLAVEYHFKKLAVETCIDIIANAITKCEFQTFEKGVETRKDNFYLFNVSPNQNQNASEFIHSLVHKMLSDNECLVIMQDKQLYVVDDYDAQEYVLKENYYKNVRVGDFTFDKIFYEDEVFRFKLNNNNIMKVIDDLYNSYGKLLSSAINIYKRSNAKRYLLKGKYLKNHDPKKQEEADKLFNQQFKTWIEADKAGAFLHLGDNLDLSDFSGSGKSGNATLNSRDIRSIVNDIIEFVAMAFHVPHGLIKGDLADIEKQVDGFIMFGIQPIAKLINSEFNRKMYSKEDYLNRTYLKIDTSMIKLLDLVSIATAADKFFAVGVNNINDNLKMLGREPINEDWANERYVTKNYQSVERINEETVKGGEGG
ncbi:MAG: phage portal protein [Bacillus sp. (in: firmicutes)]